MPLMYGFVPKKMKSNKNSFLIFFSVKISMDILFYCNVLNETFIYSICLNNNMSNCVYVVMHTKIKYNQKLIT